MACGMSTFVAFRSGLPESMASSAANSSVCSSMASASRNSS